MSKIAVIGSGFAGLSAAAYLAKLGYEVHVFEKNEHIGGRARQFTTSEGFVFDMGPSWYWMPGVFEQFFADFGYQVSDLYALKKLDPAFEVIFSENESIAIPDSFEKLCELFDNIEPNSSSKLKAFMDEAEKKYHFGVDDLIYKPALSLSEFITPATILNTFKLDIFSSFSKHIKKYFTNPKLLALMEFPILFLGAMPKNTPALYSLMNYAGLKLGTWYPDGGFASVINAIKKVGEEQGVKIHTNSAVEKIHLEKKLAKGLTVNGEHLSFDAIIASADYQHVEEKLLPKEARNYDDKYWGKKTFAPSCLIFYLGINKRVPRLLHHTLFFDEDLSEHATEIYEQPAWPKKPLFYVCCPSKTDENVAPKGSENIFLLMPIATGLTDTEALREKYFTQMLSRLEKHCGENISEHITYKKSYCVNDFVLDYNAYKGNAYGLANTLMQTATLKPKIKNKKISNLYYAGQLTVPGPGVPPSIISGKIAATLLHNEFLKK